MKTSSRRCRSRRGGVLTSAIAFVAITSALVVGMLTLAMSFYARTQANVDYEAALPLAEAGINYELRKISLSTSNADQTATSYPCGSGSFSVACSNKDGTTPWVAPNPLYITSVGTIDGVSRTVRISAKGYDWDGKYAVYSVDHLSTWNGSAITVIGDVGTNNLLSFSGSPSISGTVYFNGLGAGWAGGTPFGYTTVTNGTSQTWATVDEIALKKYPAGAYGSGGMTWLATHNDNAAASPPIVSNSITSAVSLVGPGNYYVTNINLGGSQKITFNNTAGAVNLWVGPSGGTGIATFRGGTGAIAATTDASKLNYIFVATNRGINMAGNETADAIIYAYNKTSTGTEYGSVQFSGNPTINGQLMANQADINGNVTIHYIQGTNVQTNYAYWGFDDQWTEIDGL